MAIFRFFQNKKLLAIGDIVGERIRILKDKILVNDKVVAKGLSGVIELRIIEGDALYVTADGSVVCKNVTGNVSAGGSVTCDTVGGSVSASGSVNATGPISGKIVAGGSVNIAGLSRRRNDGK